MLLAVHQNFLNLYVLEISFEKSNFFFLLELLCDDNIQFRTKEKKTHIKLDGKVGPRKTGIYFTFLSKI